jgi:hypothetical protein
VGRSSWRELEGRSLSHLSFLPTIMLVSEFASFLLRVVLRLLEKTTRENSFVYNHTASLLLVPGGNDISIHPKHPPAFSICGSAVE